MTQLSESPVERGHASVLVVGVVAVILAVVVALVGLSREVVAQGRAQTVADLSALAGVQGDAAALSVADANHGRIVHLDRTGHRVTVTVRVGRTDAVASAEGSLDALDLFGPPRDPRALGLRK